VKDGQVVADLMPDFLHPNGPGALRPLQAAHMLPATAKTSLSRYTGAFGHDRSPVHAGMEALASCLEQAVTPLMEASGGS